MRDFVLPPHPADPEPRIFTALDPFVIAEIGVNHEGSVDKAKELIDLAAGAGAHAAKFQTYTADKLAAKSTSPAYWDTTKESTLSQHELFQRFGTMGDDDYRELAEYCSSVGVVFMSTPFDLEAVDLLTPLMPVTKIASADLTNVPLLRRIRASGRPVIASVGAATHDEIEDAVARLLGDGATPPVPQLALLHCVLNYPTPREAAQLGQIRILQERFGDRVAVGYSDHVRPEDDGTMPALEMAVLYGSVVIEKHFTDDKTKPGNDHYHAMDAADLSRFTERLALYRTLNGSPELDLGTQGAAIANARRRVIAARDLATGDTIGEADLIALRSNVGIEIAHWDEVVGATVREPVAADAPVTWEAIRG
ncbi:MAG: N-acetylneuraminate synthase family protein [Microbacteriaceae bacterium]|nr:N-acetylneuraminate synthase family protein [Microbacteriaceae bacterium]